MCRHASVPQLVRQWDQNQDGDISKAELRQAVRGSLGLHATNKEIDRLFDDFDVSSITQPLRWTALLSCPGVQSAIHVLR